MLAQSLNSDSGPPPPGNNRGPEFPVDDNIFMLIGLGLVYGVFIAYKKYHTKYNPV